VNWVSKEVPDLPLCSTWNVRYRGRTIGLTSASVGALAEGEQAPEPPAADIPRFRGVSHQFAFPIAVLAGCALAIYAPTSTARASAIVFAASVAAMFGASALYHRFPCSPAQRQRLRLLDHAMIFTLIAGTYTPFGFLVLQPGWRVPILTTAWGGALLAIAIQWCWPGRPTWLAAGLGVVLGWIAVIAFPQIVDRIGVAGSLLLMIGGVAYTLGAIVYARERPDPVPHVFGYHEVFHGLVVVAVACQYSTIAFFVLPRA
jgi:hemolysin III